MSELTEFLLARIAEDEAEVQDWPTEGNWGRYDDTRMWIDPKGHPIYAPRDRVLRECEAKRALIAMREGIETEIRSVALTDPDQANGLRMSRFGLDLAIGVAASVYADHPDYRDEWAVSG